MHDRLVELLAPGQEHEMFPYVSMPRVAVSLTKLKELHGLACKERHNSMVCGEELVYRADIGKGSVAVLSWTCCNNHSAIWRSSEILNVTNNNNVYVNDIIIPASVVLTGGNYQKLAHFCKTINLQIPG